MAKIGVATRTKDVYLRLARHLERLGSGELVMMQVKSKVDRRLAAKG